MGKEIVYCVKCGSRLDEDDFRKGRARTVQNQPYCAACAPQDAPPEEEEAPVPSRATALPPESQTPRRAIPLPRGSEGSKVRKATGRIPLASLPPPAGRRSGPPSPPESGTNTTLIVGVIVGVIVIVMIVAVVGGSGGGPAEPVRSSYSPPERTTSPGREPRESREPRRTENPGPLPPADVLRELERGVQNKTPDEVLQLCDRARPALKGTPQEDRLRQIEEQARYSKVEPAMTRIRGLIKADPAYKRRGEILSDIASALASVGGKSPELEKLREDYERTYKEASERLAESTRADAERLSAEKKFDDAIRKCDEFLSMFAGTPECDAIKQLRTELEAKKKQ